MEQIMDNVHGFGLFLYNKEEKTVLGRTGHGWARISIFYLFYYLFLACLFAISINITYSCLDKEEPYYQTRLETPGVTIQPKLLSKFSLSTDIRYTISDENSYDDYVKHLDAFLAPYSGEDFGPCSTGGGYGYAENLAYSSKSTRSSNGKRTGSPTCKWKPTEQRTVTRTPRPRHLLMPFLVAPTTQASCTSHATHGKK